MNDDIFWRVFYLDIELAITGPQNAHHFNSCTTED